MTGFAWPPQGMGLVAKTEGPAALWKGITPALMRQVIPGKERLNIPMRVPAWVCLCEPMR